MFKIAARLLIDKLDYELLRNAESWFLPSVQAKLEKATRSNDRFREIVSDPLNIQATEKPRLSLAMTRTRPSYYLFYLLTRNVRRSQLLRWLV